MGSVVKASCRCGANKTIRIGGRMMTYEYLQFSPHFTAIVIVWWKQMQKRKILFYRNVKKGL